MISTHYIGQYTIKIYDTFFCVFNPFLIHCEECETAGEGYKKAVEFIGLHQKTVKCLQN